MLDTPASTATSETSLAPTMVDAEEPVLPNGLPVPQDGSNRGTTTPAVDSISVTPTATTTTSDQPGIATRGREAISPPPPLASLQRHQGIVGWFERAALHTVPAYYAITMGTGISAILLHQFPYKARWLEYLGIIIFVLNVVCFVVITLFTFARYIFWSGVFRLVLKHNVASMFWGCMPMGGATIINMICFVCVPAWGKPWAYVAYGLWWADVLASILINFGMIFVLFTRQQQTVQTLAPTWLLPVVTSVVAAATGGIVAEALMPFNAHLARSTLMASYCVWGTGVPIAMMIITLVLYRMAVHGSPQGPALASVFLPLGPCGQGSFGIITLGTAMRKLTYEFNLPMIPGIGPEEARRLADVLFAGGLVVGMIMWGLALLWYTLAVALFLDTWRREWRLLGPGKFAIGLWGLTFPIGVFATSTIALSKELDSPAFKVIAAFLAAQVVLHWLFVGIGTLWKAIDGALFAAPELVGIDEDAVRRRRSPSPTRVRTRWSNGGKTMAEADVEAPFEV